ncbi:hypothetical protein H4R35_001674 [Dimargaris xerosporica]|nr:hypothetical protein H4R35_001674 [Dimargaris xerosporica]
MIGYDWDVRTGFEHVTYGSALKLTHNPTQYKLHSEDVRYGTGSGQRSITGLDKRDHPGSLWLVQGSDATVASTPARGDIVACGATIRLQHVASAHYLHSHQQHRSPISQRQEVSAFEGTDDGDHWVVECARGTQHWTREEPISLKHAVTHQYLAAESQFKFNRPITGHLEIAAVSTKSDNCQWVAQEGFYVQAN